MSVQAFNALAAKISACLLGRPLDDWLERLLNQRFGPGSAEFEQLRALCEEGERDGWLLQREAGGIKFCRPVKPDTTAGPFSVDVVRMKDIAGPHHIHPNGEIGAVMTIAGTPKFDGKAEGWYVYPPGSDHCPTLTEGDAYVLYFLPQGAIEFTGR